MKSLTLLRAAMGVLALSLMVTSCFNQVDPGPLQNTEKDYPLFDFDRLDMGDAFIITVQQGPEYGIHVQGDRRNIDDLEMMKVGSTLKAKYSSIQNRDHSTYLTITMPVLAGANFSGACNVTINGFRSVDQTELILSGASIGQLNIESKLVSLNLSGSSRLSLSGKSESVIAKVSGASQLYAYAMEALSVDADASGASMINVYVSQSLKAQASGASVIFYRGNPVVNSNVSGASTVRAD